MPATLICPELLIEKAFSVLPAVMLSVIGLPVVATLPTAASAALFSFIEKVASAIVRPGV